MDEWPAVIGTLAGAVIGAGGTWLIERDRRKHERDTRWMADRRALYATVLRVADNYAEQALKRAGELKAKFEGRWPPDAPMTPPADETELRRAVSEAELLVAPRTEMALLFLQFSTSYFFDIRYADEDGFIPEEKIAKARKEFGDARRKFMEAVRHEFVGRRPPAPGPFRRAWRRLRRALRRAKA